MRSKVRQERVRDRVWAAGESPEKVAARVGDIAWVIAWELVRTLEIRVGI